ncbi:hypothetical protein INH39_11085 [Massilia violaceinigra]|uniref:DUF3467 domain-containing protein n=1 Tax=Massilia violaceinigra TaxID=2045208 RepID=A0ABY4AET8_9BURK|nr:hypothetical protein [Massilia violaceinigra]UOD32159.1 hypothetical protein INH39_11085 [Massilia violaceinigra]
MNLDKTSNNDLSDQENMHPYTIDDPFEPPLTTSVEVTIAFPSGPRWLFFATPQLLNDVGDIVEGSSARFHLGALHMIVVSELNLAIIDAVLRDLYKSGELEERTLPL